jgi:hypothetical protein
MPIGSSKIGVLGGLAPGGSETFNAPGTFSIPPGIRKVSITGRGGTGNPGNAGNPGNPGNPGSGGAGGSGGYGIGSPFPGATNISAGYGGSVMKFCLPGGNLFGASIPQMARGGGIGGTGGPGASGQAGSAGSAGNPGNPGQSSCGLGNTFPGGAGGNAGVGGAAGNAGTGGPGGGVGGQGNLPTAGSPGPAGPGGGAGGTGNRSGPGGPCNTHYGGKGGGGAGAVNSGATGQSLPANNPTLGLRPLGGTGNATAAIRNPLPAIYSGMSPSTQGGPGGSVTGQPQGGAGIVALQSDGTNYNRDLSGPYPFGPAYQKVGARNNISQFNPVPARPEVFRSGAGGGGGAAAFTPMPFNSTGSSGGGGAGGARGNAGNAGGGSPTPAGAAGTPQTFNCVPVTPGGTAPITVSSPGGQIVISWNPQ